MRQEGRKHSLSRTLLKKFLPKIGLLILDIEEGEERNIDVRSLMVAFLTCPDGDGTLNPVLCPDQGSSPPLSGVKGMDDAPTK